METSEVPIAITNPSVSLISQKEKLDLNNKGHQALSDAFDNILLNKTIVDQEALKNENIRFQPRCANKDTVNKDGIVGVYEYIPIVDAVNSVPDPFDIFPKIESVIAQAQGKENRQITTEIVDIINKNTHTPAFIEKFDGSIGSWGRVDTGDVYPHASQNTIDVKGLRVNKYECSDEVWSELQEKGYSQSLDFSKTTGSVILVNEAKADDISTIATPVHEIGHVVENEFVLPQKQSELKGKDYYNSEVISTLYGIKTGIMMAEVDKAKATEMIIYQAEIYNWILTGTVAP